MDNTYFATALISEQSVGITIHAESIETAFELAEGRLEERYPRSEVMIQAVQRIDDEFGRDLNARSHATPTLAEGVDRANGWAAESNR
jgi:hypothetical protein